MFLPWSVCTPDSYISGTKVLRLCVDKSMAWCNGPLFHLAYVVLLIIVAQAGQYKKWGRPSGKTHIDITQICDPVLQKSTADD